MHTAQKDAPWVVLWEGGDVALQGMDLPVELLHCLLIAAAAVQLLSFAPHACLRQAKMKQDMSQSIDEEKSQDQTVLLLKIYN